MFIVFSDFKKAIMERPEIDILLIPHVAFRSSDGYFGLFCTKQNTVPPAIVTKYTNKALEFPWVA